MASRALCLQGVCSEVGALSSLVYTRTCSSGVFCSWCIDLPGVYAYLLLVIGCFLVYTPTCLSCFVLLGPFFMVSIHQTPRGVLSVAVSVFRGVSFQVVCGVAPARASLLAFSSLLVERSARSPRRPGLGCLRPSVLSPRAARWVVARRPFSSPLALVARLVLALTSTQAPPCPPEWPVRPPLQCHREWRHSGRRGSWAPAHLRRCILTGHTAHYRTYECTRFQCRSSRMAQRPPQVRT